nr:6-phospho-beta-glucosidase [Martelella sp. HB161492]
MTLIGGGGVRSPLFVASALRRAERSGLKEICLHDVDAKKLEIFGGIAAEITRRVQSPVRITTSLDAERALEGADYVVTTVRPGGEDGRVKDERIALSHGVLGQETTGPGGFAMALRSIPVITEYASLLKRVSPDAWLFNFTNPAGLVAQALSDAGFDRVVGICDGANAAQEAVAQKLDVSVREVQAEVFGLNHLSYTRAAYVDGKEVLQGLLDDDSFLAETPQRIFDPAIIRRHRLWLNEYLYYFYYAEKALGDIQADTRTRGEEVRDLNRDLVAQLSAIGVDRDAEAALSAYFAYEQRREATYMHYARPEAPSMEDADKAIRAVGSEAADGVGEGYAGVALNIIDALQTGVECHIGLNLRNGGAIEGLADDDVVEVSCVVDGDGIRTKKIGAIPDGPAQLIHNIKRYERLAVRAIATRSRDLAVEALVAHPLVLSYSRAEPLVDEYLSTHAEFAGEWR